MLLRLIYIAFGIFLTASLFSCQESNEPEKRPNILFAISDDQSFPHTSFHGTSWVSTPAFDRIAREGIYFSNCYAGSPGCAPSRSSIVTGRYHWQNEQAGQHAAGWFDKYTPFVDVLDTNGYYTGYTGKGVGPFKYGDSPLRSQNAAGKAYNEIAYEDDGPNDERFASAIRNTNYFANFKQFIEQREADTPFFFWYGASEPHRAYEQGSWKRYNKSLDSVNVPAFLPNTEKIRGDLLDYAVEIEWFDLHLGCMIDYLEEIGELENTIIIVTADNGMPFPRAKANAYEYGVHVPMAVRFPKEFPGGRKVDNPISFIDLAPTILELTQTSSEGMLPISGQSLVNLLTSEQEGTLPNSREYAMAGRERHSSSRYQNLGYPQRLLRQGDYLFIWNIKPERWPAGAPQRLVSDSTEELRPLYGIDEEGIHHSDWAFTDIDAAPTKSFIVENHDDPAYAQYFELSIGKRPEYELFNVKDDPNCLTNLANDPEFTGLMGELNETMIQELTKTEDPRVVGSDPDLFESYPRYSPMRYFPKPDWML
ncbi:MAG: sulfatase [Bacteroidota bacterium]